MHLFRHIFLLAAAFLAGLSPLAGYGDEPGNLAVIPAGIPRMPRNDFIPGASPFYFFLVFGTIVLIFLLVKGGKKERQSHGHEDKYRNAKPSRTPWWNIPRKKRIFIDTCVLMEAYSDTLTDNWFKHLKMNAKGRKWIIVILQSVLKELDGLKHDENGERAQASRHASAILGDLQRRLGPHFVITGSYRTPADDEFEREMKKGDILCTRDNNLALRINGHKDLKALGLVDFPRSRHPRRRS